MQEPFKSLPLVWVINEKTLAVRSRQYNSTGHTELLTDWKKIFSRASVVVFHDYLLPVNILWLECNHQQIFNFVSALDNYFFSVDLLFVSCRFSTPNLMPATFMWFLDLLKKHGKQRLWTFHGKMTLSFLLWEVSSCTKVNGWNMLYFWKLYGRCFQAITVRVIIPISRS